MKRAVIILYLFLSISLVQAGDDVAKNNFKHGMFVGLGFNFPARFDKEIRPYAIDIANNSGKMGAWFQFGYNLEYDEIIGMRAECNFGALGFNWEKFDENAEDRFSGFDVFNDKYEDRTHSDFPGMANNGITVVFYPKITMGRFALYPLAGVGCYYMEMPSISYVLRETGTNYFNRHQVFNHASLGFSMCPGFEFKWYTRDANHSYISICGRYFWSFYNGKYSIKQFDYAGNETSVSEYHMRVPVRYISLSLNFGFV
ncbi:MAG: hypothetical protein ACHQF2_04790 [Flavobacteriales bacterium]